MELVVVMLLRDNVNVDLLVVELFEEGEEEEDCEAEEVEEDEDELVEVKDETEVEDDGGMDIVEDEDKEETIGETLEEVGLKFKIVVVVDEEEYNELENDRVEDEDDVAEDIKLDNEAFG